jgi:hypothetical protein
MAIYYYQNIENFEGSTANTLLNLPPWFIITIIVFIMICIILSMVLQFLPWMYGIKTVGNIGTKAVNGYFGPKTSIVPVKPITANSS